jgi:hypothetical protein
MSRKFFHHIYAAWFMNFHVMATAVKCRNGPRCFGAFAPHSELALLFPKQSLHNDRRIAFANRATEALNNRDEAIILRPL